MPEWWTYGLADAQIFSARSYGRLVERCMREAWPAQLVATLLGVAVAGLLAWRPMPGARTLAAAAALACAAVAAWWLPRCHAELHWASGAIAAGFWLQALLLAVAAVSPRALPHAAATGARACALTLLTVAVALLPWLTLHAAGSPWHAEVAGLMPAPTIAASLAVLPLCSMRWRLLLLPLPLAGTLLEAVTLASIGRQQWVLLPLVVAVLAAMLAALRGRIAPRT